MSDVTTPIVSICCITYNHVRYIRQCIEGFLMQETSFPYEILIHDDASNDGTSEIIEEYANKFPDIIKPIIQKENQYSKGNGFSGTRLNLERAKGKYLACCEGDDYWTDTLKLQKQFDIMESHPEFSICYHNVKVVNADCSSTDDFCPTIGGLLYGKTVVTLKDLLYELCYNNRFSFHASSYFLRNAVSQYYLNHIDDVFSDWPYGDVPLQIAFLLNGNGCVLQEPMSCYRRNPTSYSSTVWNILSRRLNEEAKEHNSYSKLDVFLNYKYHSIIKYRLRQIELNRESEFNAKRYVLFKPKFWCLLKLRTYRANLSYFVHGILQLLHIEK